MSRRLRNRTEMLTAFVAAIAILVGPVVAFGTCCCSIAAAAQQTDATICEHTVGGSVASSCETAVPAAASSCCTAKATKLTDSRPCCQPPSARAPESSPLGKTPCTCTESCCDAALSDSTAILIEPVLQRDLSGDWVALTTVLEPAPRDLFAAPGNVLRQPAFLSAQAHCAMLCRWLN
jgi:hypothetical protein